MMAAVAALSLLQQSEESFHADHSPLPRLNASFMRGMRPDAYRFIRHDWRRDVRPAPISGRCTNASSANTRPTSRACRRAYGKAGSGRTREAAEEVAQVVSGPAAMVGVFFLMRRWTMIGYLALNMPRVRRGASGRVFVNGREVEATAAQEARLAVVEAQARDAIRRVQDIDPTWKPTQSFRFTVEGEIVAVKAEAREAEARLSELSRVGIGPGPYAGDFDFGARA